MWRNEKCQAFVCEGRYVPRGWCALSGLESPARYLPTSLLTLIFLCLCQLPFNCPYLQRDSLSHSLSRCIKALLMPALLASVHIHTYTQTTTRNCQAEVTNLKLCTKQKDQCSETTRILCMHADECIHVYLYGCKWPEVWDCSKTLAML